MGPGTLELLVGQSHPSSLPLYQLIDATADDKTVEEFVPHLVWGSVACLGFPLPP